MASVFVATGEVLMLNVAEVASFGIVTVLGAVALAVLLEIDTTAPDGPARLSRVSVATEGSPPGTVVGFRVIDVRFAGRIVSGADPEPPPKDDEIVAITSLSTVRVCIGKVAMLECFPRMGGLFEYLLGGNTAAALLLEMDSDTSDGPIGPLSTTVTALGESSGTEEGSTETEITCGAVTVTFAV